MVIWLPPRLRSPPPLLLPEARLGEEGYGVHWKPVGHLDPQMWERGTLCRTQAGGTER